MKIVLFRHGIAEDREIFARTGLPDSERPLTGKGEQKTRRAAAGLVSILDTVEVIGTSPYTRARQTADILARACADAGRMPEPGVVEAMQPGGDPLEICRWLANEGAKATAVLVGHEPDLSQLATWLTSGEPGGFMRFRKAGACLIAFPSRPVRGGGELLWLMPPAVLQRLAAA